jgi:hypothetical protein
MQQRLDVVVSAVARDAGLDPDNNPTDKQNIIGWVNDTRRELYDIPQMFSALQFSGEIAGVALVTAGTVSVSGQGAEVTGAGTAWTSEMAGRYISVADGSWQRIAYVADTTHLFLESRYPGDAASAQTYKIWKRYYELPPKAARVTRLVDYGAVQNPMAYYDPQEFYSRFNLAASPGDPVAFTQFMASDFGVSYQASTVYVSVSSTANSPILDFPASSDLVGKVFPGDRLKVGNATTSTAFAIENVLSNAKVALKNYLGTSSDTLSATALSMDRLLVAFYPGINSTRVYAFEGVRQVHDLSNNGDLLEKGWYSAVLKGAKAKAFGFVRDPREEMAMREYNAEVGKLLRGQAKALNPSPRLKPHIGIRYGQSYPAAQDRDTGY